MRVTVAGSGLGFTEGPVHRRSGEIVVTSISLGHIYELTNAGAMLLAALGGGPNGAAEGADGTLFVAQNGGQGPGWKRLELPGGLQRIAPDGTIGWLTQDPIAPNDLCFGPDGNLYVTDPTRSALDDGRLWRCDPVTGDSEILASVPFFPNGIAFGPDDDAIFVASTRDRRILRYPILTSGLGQAEVVIAMEYGYPDGLAFDMEGDLVIAAIGRTDGPGEIQTWTVDGALIDRFRPGSSAYYTNIALTADRRLIVTDSDGGGVLIVEEWPRSGLPLHPFRA